MSHHLLCKQADRHPGRFVGKHNHLVCSELRNDSLLQHKRLKLKQDKMYIMCLTKQYLTNDNNNNDSNDDNNNNNNNNEENNDDNNDNNYNKYDNNDDNNNNKEKNYNNDHKDNNNDK